MSDQSDPDGIARRPFIKKAALTSSIGLAGISGFTGTAAANFGLDIKPHSDPNSFNLCSNGVLPVAIIEPGPDREINAKEVYECLEKKGAGMVRFGDQSLTEDLYDYSDGFDEGNDDIPRGAGANPIKWHLEDVDGDGMKDLVLHFRMKDVRKHGDFSKTSTIGALTVDSKCEGVNPRAHWTEFDSVNVVKADCREDDDDDEDDDDKDDERGKGDDDSGKDHKEEDDDDDDEDEEDEEDDDD